MAIVLPEDFHKYLSRLAGGSADLEPWREWVTAHQSELIAVLSRARYLRLKFEPQASVPELLSELELTYDANVLRPLLRRAQKGQGWLWTPADAYGVSTLYAKGRAIEADEMLKDMARQLARSDDVERGSRLGEMVMDAEILVEEGYTAEAIGLLNAVASLDHGDDLVDDAVFHAAEVLAGLRSRRSTE